MLGGWKAGINAQTMQRKDLPEVWQDRTLAQACHLMSGAPEIKLLSAGEGISPELLAELASTVALPKQRTPQLPGWHRTLETCNPIPRNRLILKVISDPDEQVSTLANIVAQESVNYLDVAVVNRLWEAWQLSDAFTFEITKGLLRTD
jgi:hypothetical protein